MQAPSLSLRILPHDVSAKRGIATVKLSVRL